MSEVPTDPRPVQRRSASPAFTLRVLGIVVMVSFIVVGVLRLASRSGEASPMGLAELAEFGLFVLLGIVCGGLFAGISSMLKALRGLHASMVRVEQMEIKKGGDTPGDGDTHVTMASAVPAVVETEKPESAQSASAAGPDGQWQQLLTMVDDLRDSMLLSPEERKEKRRLVFDRDLFEARHAVQKTADKGDFAHAREYADALCRRYPNNSDAESLIEYVEQARNQHEAEDVRSITRQVNDLMSISAWERARQLAQRLLESHPDSVEARHLWLKLEREQRLFDIEQQRRMGAEIQRFVNNRRWEEALAGARIFVKRFPHSEDSEVMRMQIPTLEANAEIETRQRIEAQIMEYAKHGRYIEAASLARKIVEEYPDSPQAQVLRSQLGRLEELAQNPNAPRARVRIDGM